MNVDYWFNNKTILLECSKSKLCYQCSSSDPGVCTACGWPGNQDSGYGIACSMDIFTFSLMNHSLADYPTASYSSDPYCAQFNNDNSLDCLQCKDGYYLVNNGGYSYYFNQYYDTCS